MKEERRPLNDEIDFLIDEFGSIAAVAVKLDVDATYVRMLRKGLVPGVHLYKEINRLYRLRRPSGAGIVAQPERMDE